MGMIIDGIGVELAKLVERGTIRDYDCFNDDEEMNIIFNDGTVLHIFTSGEKIDCDIVVPNSLYDQPKKRVEKE
jgi:hypothetical protein